LAIAVIIGAAFGAIITSLVEDVITPLILTPALRMAHAENIDQLAWGTVKYGKFLAAILKFLVVALVLFAIIKGINRMNRRKAEQAAAPKPPEYSLSLDFFFLLSFPFSFSFCNFGGIYFVLNFGCDLSD